MKPFLCVDITENPTNTLPNGEEFIELSTSAENLERYDNAVSALESTSKVQIPSVIAFWRLELLAAVIAFVLMIIFLPSFLLSEGFKSVINLILMLALLITGVYLLTKWGKKEARKKINPEDVAQIASAVQLMRKDIQSELGTPEDANDSEILCFSYEAGSKDENFAIHDQENKQVKIYMEKDSICFATLEHKYTVPMDALQKIIRTEEQYHILEFSHSGEQWGIFFPCSELPIFEKLTGLKAQ